MCRFALHRQGQSSHLSRAARPMACRGSVLVLPNGAGLGYRPNDLNRSPCTGKQRGFLPALGDHVSTLGEIR